MTVYSAGVNSAFQAAQTNEQFGVELFGVNYSLLESSFYLLNDRVLHSTWDRVIIACWFCRGFAT
jgi:hypothetical protein